MVVPRSIAVVVWLLLFALAVGCGGCTLARGEPRKEADTLRDLRQLTSEARFEDATGGRFSPDMKWLAFRATPAGEHAPQLYLAPVLYEGEAGEVVAGLGNPVRITPPNSRNASPTFSPDNHSLAFVSTSGSDSDPLRRGPSERLGFEAIAEIFRVDGWQRHVAAGDVRKGVNLARHPITRNRGFDGEPAWSPDGRWLAFASDRAAPDSAIDTRSLVDLYVMPADGKGEAIRVTDTQGYDGAPAWLPGGRSLIFESDRRATGRFDLYRVDLEFDAQGNVTGAKPPVRLTEVVVGSDDSARQPAVHPSGDVVVYVARRGDDQRQGNSDLRQMRPDGQRDFDLTFDAAADEAPSFSPDGRFLVFTSRRTSDGSRQLFVGRYIRPRRM